MAAASQGWTSESVALPALHEQLYSYLQHGQYRRAATILEEARKHPGGDLATGQRGRPVHWTATNQLIQMAARYALETENWNMASELVVAFRVGVSAEDWRPRTGDWRLFEPSHDLPETAWYAAGIAFARLAMGRLDKREIMLASAYESANRLDAIADAAGRRSFAEMQRLGVLAAIAAAQEEREEMDILLEHAAALENETRRQRPCYPVIPMHELAGDLWFQVHRHADALREYLASIERHPERVRSVVGAARAAAKVGDEKTARAKYAHVLELWKDADQDRPELSEARRYLGM